MTNSYFIYSYGYLDLFNSRIIILWRETSTVNKATNTLKIKDNFIIISNLISCKNVKNHFRSSIKSSGTSRVFRELFRNKSQFSSTSQLVECWRPSSLNVRVIILAVVIERRTFSLFTFFRWFFLLLVLRPVLYTP